MWEIDKEKTKDHWLELKDPEGWWSAIVKWDGCIHLNRYYNEPWGGTSATEKEINTDYIHICDLDGFIKIMEELRDKAKGHFGEWPR